MSLDKKQYEAHKVVDKFELVNGVYQMSVRDQVLRVVAERSGGFVITLPSVAQARGLFFSIIMRTGNAVDAVTVQDQDESECWEGDITLNAPCDKVLLYSDGLSWCHVCSDLGSTQSTPIPTTIPTTLG